MFVPPLSPRQRGAADDAEEVGAQPNSPNSHSWGYKGCRTMGMRGWDGALPSDPHGDLPPRCLPPSRDVASPPCQKSDKKGKEQNINLELQQAGYGSCSGSVVSHTVELRMLQNPFAQGNSGRSIGSIFNPCCSGRALPCSPLPAEPGGDFFNLS